jgi:hypothetical protein
MAVFKNKAISNEEEIKEFTEKLQEIIDKKIQNLKKVNKSLWTVKN